jgi:poly(3-hydroxybutyrate) depolymerase
MSDLAALVAHAGVNDLPWTDPALPGQPLVLRAARPQRFSPETPVLFVHHGVKRNGADYRDYWLPLVDEADLLVVVPEFTEASFPGPRSYNFGNREDAAGRPLPRQAWSYAVDGHLFAALCTAGITRRQGYGLFGHSAGGQFVHRMLSLGFRAHVIAAVAANAGTYAMPNLGVPFPYGLAETGTDPTQLAEWLRFPLTVMAGSNDTDTTSEHFPREAAAMRQGPTRLARARRYVETAQAEAARRGVPCAWRLIEVPGVGHDGERMGAAAAPLLAAALHAI